MNQIFSLDGPIFKILSKFYDMLILSILWIIFSSPIVTIGPASSALYHSTHKVLFNNEGHVFSTFWKSFRMNLKQGILLTLLCILIGGFGIVCYCFSNSLPKGNLLAYLYFAIAILAILLFLIMVTYMFPVLSRFYMKSRDIFKTTVALAVTRFGFTLFLIFIFLICAVAFLIVPATGFILPACYTIAAERLLEPAFQKALDAKEKAEKEDCADSEN